MQMFVIPYVHMCIPELTDLIGNSQIKPTAYLAFSLGEVFLEVSVVFWPQLSQI